ncbi:MAG TPA: ribbon-helix-helix protein, CopG family [Candidatus Methylomirabilis sp.]|nr:ribbon-helix-helix protein, CopG family [Candidatus Methylomirabilis sp.]
MARRTRVLGFSVSPEIADEYERLAKRERRSKSDLFREMIVAYKAKRAEEEFLRLQIKMSRRARAKGVLTENDVERLVFEDR